MPVAADQLKLALAPALSVTTAAELSLASPRPPSTSAAEAPGVTSRLIGRLIAEALLTVASCTTAAKLIALDVLPVEPLILIVRLVAPPV